jgi:hypothetical protein
VVVYEETPCAGGWSPRADRWRFETGFGAGTQQGCTLKPHHHRVQCATNSLFGLQEIRHNPLVHLIRTSCDGVAVKKTKKSSALQRHPPLGGQGDPGTDLIDWCEGFCLLHPDPGSLQPKQTRDEQGQEILQASMSCSYQPIHTCVGIAAIPRQNSTQDPSTPSQVCHRTHATLSNPSSQMLPSTLCADLLFRKTNAGDGWPTAHLPATKSAIPRSDLAQNIKGCDGWIVEGKWCLRPGHRVAQTRYKMQSPSPQDHGSIPKHRYLLPILVEILSNPSSIQPVQ